MAISIGIVGKPPFERYVLQNSQNQVWTGTEWSPDSKKRLLYADASVAASDSHRLLEEEFKDKKERQQFVVPLTISLASDTKLSCKELLEWLNQSISVFVDYERCGYGPNGSLALIEINLGAITEELCHDPKTLTDHPPAAETERNV